MRTATMARVHPVGISDDGMVAQVSIGEAPPRVKQREPPADEVRLFLRMLFPGALAA